MIFSQIPYERVDMDALKARILELTQALAAASDFEAAERAYLAADALEGQTVRTMRTLAQIRRDMDTRDAFYDGEIRFYDRELPKVQQLKKGWTQTLLNSPFRPRLEEKYGKVSFLNEQLHAKSFSPEIVADLQKENELVSRYTRLIASAQIDFDGKQNTIPQMEPYKLSTDDEVRRAAWRAEGGWYASHGKELDDIYDELVALRDGMGRKLGMDGYTELGYCRMLRNCYTQADVEKFRMAVQKYVVPVCKRIYQKQAQRMGFDFPMSFADKDLAFPSGNPKPKGDVLAAGSRFYAELSPETGEFWSSMMQQELMDVHSRPGKAMGGYCTDIRALKMPFIFANFNGTAHDVKVITHEAGHAFATWVNRDRVPGDTMWPSLEGCEVHSMAMEFFAEPWSELFFGADGKKFNFTHLSERLCFIPYGTMVDHFQHIIYEYPEFGPQERHMVWQELLGVYMPWLRPDDIPFYGEGKGWQRQMHIYKRPFYYIDYCLAQTVALQFWARIQENPKAAWQTYMDYTSLGGSMVFTDLLKAAGLDSPFDESCLRDICVKANAWLDSVDVAQLEQ